MIVTDYDLAFCTILTIMAKKSSTGKTKKLLEQK